MLEVTNSLPADEPEACPGEARHLLAPWQANRVREFIDANLGEQISVGALAGVAGISPSHFYRVFKGRPPPASL